MVLGAELLRGSDRFVGFLRESVEVQDTYAALCVFAAPPLNFARAS